MATKKQKRLRMQERRAAFMENEKQLGLAAQRADQERRRQAAENAEKDRRNNQRFSRQNPSLPEGLARMNRGHL